VVRALLVATIIVAACIPTSKSEEFTCTSQADCRDGRMCSEGYCVFGTSPMDAPNGCPPGCDDCNVSLKTCSIECRTPGACTQVECPAGYECDIVCESNACPVINCTGAAGCTIDCQGDESCPAIACGAGYCDIECDDDACGQISCGASCACDVNCQAVGGGRCGTQACPTSGNDECTDTGTPAGDCTSSAPGCDMCP